MTNVCPKGADGKEFDCRAKDGVLPGDSYISGGSTYTSAGGGGCTTGFAWLANSKKYILTAGHCNPTEMSDQTSVGTVKGSTVRTGTGTVPRPNETSLHGDLSLIELKSPLIPTASIFYGAGIENPDHPAGAFKRPIYGRYGPRSQVGDRFCVGGAMSGETRVPQLVVTRDAEFRL